MSSLVKNRGIKRVPDGNAILKRKIENQRKKVGR